MDEQSGRQRVDESHQGAGRGWWLSEGLQLRLWSAREEGPHPASSLLFKWYTRQGRRPTSQGASQKGGSKSRSGLIGFIGGDRRGKRGYSREMGNGRRGKGGAGQQRVLAPNLPHHTQRGSGGTLDGGGSLPLAAGAPRRRRLLRQLRRQHAHGATGVGGHDGVHLGHGVGQAVGGDEVVVGRACAGEGVGGWVGGRWCRDHDLCTGYG